MSRPLVSVVIPVYNAEKSGIDIVKSVLSQTCKDFELILIDDGSTDKTLSLLRAAKKADDRVRVFTKPNGGPSSARNFGLDKAIGKFIQFYDADDDVVADALSKMVGVAEREGSDLVVSGWQIDLHSSRGLIKGYKIVSPRRESITSNQKDYILASLGESGKLYNLWNKLFLNDIIQKNSLRFDEELRFGEDLIFSMQYMSHVGRLDIIPDITYQYQASSETSIFTSSSLVPSYRIANDQALLNFAGKRLTDRQKDLVQWIRWRWLISYWSLVAFSGKKLSEKIQLIQQFSPNGLSLVKNPDYIGLSNYVLQLFAFISQPSAAVSLFLGFLLSSIKGLIVFTKTKLSRYI